MAPCATEWVQTFEPKLWNKFKECGIHSGEQLTQRLTSPPPIGLCLGLLT